MAWWVHGTPGRDLFRGNNNSIWMGSGRVLHLKDEWKDILENAIVFIVIGNELIE